MSHHDVALTVNGAEEELTVEPRALLVHALRDDLDYTGPKVGCESSKCGACTVHLDGEAVKSCTVLAVQADGCEVTTVEGLGGAPDRRAGRAEPETATGDLHPVQARLHEEHGLQCGYCTPGMTMTTTALLRDRSDLSRGEIRRALKGNICRCTGYQNVVDAVESAARDESGGAVSMDETTEAAVTDDPGGGE